MMSRRLIGFVCVLGFFSATPAWAQAPAPAAGSGIGLRAFAHLEWQMMAAKDSFDAVAETFTLMGFGGGAEAQRLWRGLFARAAISRMSKTGERVFIFDEQVFRLGTPLDIKLTPIEVAAGWRFVPMTSRGIVPYVGGGALILKYSESSPGDSTGEGVSENYNGFLVFGGVEVPVWRYVSAGAEVGWRKANVPDPGGAFEAFDEKDLGGITARVMVSIRR